MDLPLPHEPRDFTFAVLEWLLAAAGIRMNRAKTRYFPSIYALAEEALAQDTWTYDQSLVFAENMDHFVVLQPALDSAGLVVITSAGAIDLVEPTETSIEELTQTLVSHCTNGPVQQRPRY